MTNQEKQAAYEARRKARIEELAALAAAAKAEREQEDKA